MSKSPTDCVSQPSAAALWLVDGHRVPEHALARGRRELSTAEAHRYNYFMRRERQSQYLLGRMLVRHAAADATGLPYTTISTLEHLGCGPRLLLPDGAQQPCFSLSHSRHWIACAVGFEVALGLDIEVIDPERDVLALAATAFHVDEQDWLRSHSNTERCAAFYRLWTLKEALFKLLSNAGEGQVVTSLVACDGTLLSHGDGWFASHLPHPALSITLCSTHAAPDIALLTPYAAWSLPD